MSSQGSDGGSDADTRQSHADDDRADATGEKAGAPVKLHYLTALGFGDEHEEHAGITYLSDGVLLYKVGQHIAVCSHETAHFRFLLKQPSISDVHCFATSHNRKYIALSEQSVAERSGGTAGVSIWAIDAKSDLSDPLQAKKVRSFSFSYLSKQPAVAMGFSRDNKSLATATMLPDGFLFLWQLDKACKLLAMSELTAPVTQCSISAYTGATICTTGPTAVRLWRYQQPNQLRSYDPMHKKGEYKYTAHCWVDADTVLVTTHEGDVLVIVNMEFRKAFSAVHPDSLPINAVAAMSRGFICAGDGGFITLFERSYDGSLYNKYKVFQAPGERRIKNIAVALNEETVLLSCHGNTALLFSLTNIDVVESGRDAAPHDGAVEAASSSEGKEDGEFVFKPLNIGFHSDSVTAVSVCVQRSVVVTASLDNRVIMWNYLKRRTEIDHKFSEEVHAASCHPSGHRLMLAFKYRMALFVVLSNSLHQIQEFPVKSCKEIVYANGGHLFAASVVTKIFIYNSYNFTCVGFLAAHTSMVRSLQWVNSDQNIISGGYEGAIYFWDVETCKKIDTYDCVTKAAAHSCVRYDEETQCVVSVGSNKIGDSGLSEGAVAARVFSLVGNKSALRGRRSHTSPTSAGNDVVTDSQVLSPTLDAPDGDLSPLGKEGERDGSEGRDSDDKTAAGQPEKESLEPSDAVKQRDAKRDEKGSDESGNGSAIAALVRPIVLGSVKERQGHTKTHTVECAVSQVHRCVFLGTTSGAIAVYPWPMKEACQPICALEAHQSTVTFLVLSPDEDFLFSVGEDRSLFVFEVSSITRAQVAEKARRPAFNHATFEDITYVLKSDLDAQHNRMRELTNANEELEEQQAQELVKMRQQLEVLVAQTRAATAKKVEEHYHASVEAQREKETVLANATDKEAVHEKLHLKAAEDLESLYTAKTESLDTSYKHLKDQKEDLVVMYEDKLYNIRKQWAKEREQMTLSLQELEVARKRDMHVLMREREHLKKQGDEKLQLLEQEYEDELHQIKERYRSEKRVKDAVCERELIEWSMGQRKQEKNAIELERLQNQLKQWEDVLTKAKLKNKEQEKANEALRLEIDVRIDTIATSDKKIIDLRKQTAELEKLRCVLVFKFNELRKEVSPKEAQIKMMHERIEEMVRELEKVSQDTDALARALATKDEKIQVVQREIAAARRQVEAKALLSRSLIRHLLEIASHGDERKMLYTLRDAVEAHSNAQVASGAASQDLLSGKGRVLHEFHRQRAHIEKQLASMSKQTCRREFNLSQDNQRKTAENSLLVREINVLRHEKKAIVENINNTETSIKELYAKHDKLKAPMYNTGDEGFSFGGGAPPSSTPQGKRAKADNGRLRRPATAAMPPRSASMLDKVKIDSIYVAEVIQEVEKNNHEMAKQQADIQRLREFVAHLLRCASLETQPTQDQTDTCNRITSDLTVSNPSTVP